MTPARIALLLLGLLLSPLAQAQTDADTRLLAERLFGPIPNAATVVLHPMPWGAVPPASGTTHVLVAQDAHMALLAMIGMVPADGGAVVPHVLGMGQAGDPAHCEVPPGMPEGPGLEEFNAPRESENTGLGQPIVTVVAADEVPLIGLTWRVGERGAAAQATALFRVEGNAMREVGCFITRLDATMTLEPASEGAPPRRRRVSSVWRIERGPNAETPLLLRDTARPQRPLAIRLDPDFGRYAIVVPPPREERPARPRR